MAEGLPTSPSGGAGCLGLHSGIIHWLVDNFCICEGYSVPRSLIYEIYVETYGRNAQNHVSPAMFGKLVHLVFPDLGTRRLGTRGSARYHYDGICIKKSSIFYAQYCYLLGKERYHSGDVVAFDKSTNYGCIIQQEGTCGNHSPIKTGTFRSPLSEIRRCPFWEQELAKKYSYKMMALLADEYCNYCQDILQNVRNQELERRLFGDVFCRIHAPVESIYKSGVHHQVKDLLISFWKSLQQDTVVLMSLPDVCQLFKCYDVQMYKRESELPHVKKKPISMVTYGSCDQGTLNSVKALPLGIEDTLLRDFLEDVSIQYLKFVRLFSKKFKLWLLHALEGFPALLQISKLKDVTVFVKRLRRKTYLSNMAKTMRMLLENNKRVHMLKSDLHAIMESSKTAPPGHPRSADNLEKNMETKCLSSLISLLGTSTDLCDFLNCLSSYLQAFVFQPSRSKEEFIKLAANFQLRWNFLLTAVSKAMTLNHRDSFGFWHLFHLLLLEYVIHILQSCIEEEEEEGDVGNLKAMLPDNQCPVQPDQAPFHHPEAPLSQEYGGPIVDPPQVMLKHASQSLCAMGVSSVVLRVLGFLVDTATGNKFMQVSLEHKATESTIRLNLPVGQEALVTLEDGQKFVIHVSDVPQSSGNIYFRESNANK